MKKLLLISLTMLICVGLFAGKYPDAKIPAPTYELSPTASYTGVTAPNRDTWDILNVFDCSAPSHPGTETDGINIYTTAWNAGAFSRYEMDGTYLTDFTVGGVSNIRDMAYDGTYFYGSPATMTIYIMDLANESLIGTIPVSCAGLTGVRHIAFDPELDGANGGFWVGNWNELGAITMSGAQIYGNISPTILSLYGSAYDEWTDGGPYLWVFSQEPNPAAVIHQFEIATQTFTGVTHDASDIPGFIAGSIAGGLATYVNDDGLFVMLANIQQSPNIVGVYEIAITADPAAPGAPTDVVVTPDAGGALEADIDWTCPSVSVNGDPLTDLDEMRVYRDGTLIYTDTSPTIGGAGSYLDPIVPAAGFFSYSVVGYNDLGEGIPVSVTVWVGEDVPDAVTDLILTDISTGDLAAQLDWINPTTGLHGGYFTGVLGYDIERSDGAVFVVTGSTTQWIDNTLVSPGVYSYTVTPFNASGSGPSTTSPQVGIGVSIIQIGNAEVDDYQIPMNLFYMDSMTETIYLQEWIGTDMLINTISYHANTTTTIPNDFILEVWMGETQETTLSAGWIEGSQLTQVFVGTVTVPAGESWVDFPLDTAFEYEYSGNLVVMIIREDDEYFLTTDFWKTTESGTAFRTRLDFTDNSGGQAYQGLTGPFTSTMEKSTYSDIRFYYSALEHGDVEGVVTDAVTSNPIDGVEIFVGAFGPATTNALGEYLLEDIVIGTHEVTAFKDGYYNFVGSVEVLTNQVVQYDFVMDPFEFATLAGNVTDVDTSLPIEDAEIYLLSVLGYEYWVTTNASGDYSIVDVISDTYDITCTATMYIPQTVQDIVFDTGANIIQDFALEISIYYFSDFEDNDGYLLSSDPTGWAWGTPTSGPGTAHSGSNVWGTVLGGNYANGADWTLETTIPVGVVSTAYMLDFWHWYDIEASYDGGNVKISTDGGSSWNVIVPLTGYTGVANTSNPLNGEEIFCGHDQGYWEFVEFDLSAFVGENILVRWHFGSDSSVIYPGWYIDDVTISDGGAPDPGYIEGTVEIAEGAGNVEDVEVEAGGVIVNPLANGTYSIELQPGTYDVTATLDGYDTEVIEDVLVTEGNVTTGVDFSLVTDGDEIIIVATKLDNNYPNPFNPDTNINYSIKEAGYVTIEVYNIKGQLVKILVNDMRETGNYTAVWNGTDSSSKSVASGVYFYKMKSGDYTATKKMILMK
ncbi:MAG: carboxypeptidase regulatory-like domain-containing protein [Candidatus Cloacimonetes bacterium]|nr:carboxypeptidase regulatory-like domain-containing protein [Candidatus Cloacimonadota bacterium]